MPSGKIETVMAVKLGVNIDHIATLRQARRIDIPDPLACALVCERAGCDSIVCHLRQDRRHIQDRDVKELRKIVSTKLNLEMSCAAEIVDIATAIKPNQATLVPERRQELTTEGGLDVVANQKKVSKVVRDLTRANIMVSLFIDPEEAQIAAAKETSAKCIELHTGRYADAHSTSQANAEWQKLLKSAQLAQRLGIKVFAGHGLNYKNVNRVIQIKEIEELNIGFSIIARAVFVGLENAVKEMLSLVKERPDSHI